MKCSWVVLQRRIASTIASLSLTCLFVGLVITPAAIAQSYGNNQSNQAMPSVSLVAPEPDQEISIYPQPDTRKTRIGFGKRGDRVTVLEQLSRNNGTTWDRIRFVAPPHAEGWVQGKYLSVPTSGQYDQGDRGKRSQPSWWRSSQGNS